MLERTNQVDRVRPGGVLNVTRRGIRNRYRMRVIDRRDLLAASVQVQIKVVELGVVEPVEIDAVIGVRQAIKGREGAAAPSDNAATLLRRFLTGVRNDLVEHVGREEK